MGWWDEGILGGDLPYDVRGDFEDKFGSNDETFNEMRAEDGDPPIPFVVPTVEQSIEFLNSFGAGSPFFDDADRMIVRQVTGYMLIARAAPFSNEIRTLVLEGIDNEIAGGCETWNVPEQRIAALQDFRMLVAVYPLEGAPVEMPEQTGLFAKMAEKFS